MLVACAAGLALSACQDSGGLDSGRAWKPIPRETLALMEAKGTTKHSPILVRAFKKEAELEIWKMKADGTYALLKTYPVCRWSGQLGPKKREGDRQVPEGFYSVSPGLMNPNSNYYLSFNIGYPNAYDRAHGYTGGLIMVHGACSSAGCFSMTDEQMAEIYAIAREAFAGGQRSIQVQSLPFRMTPQNMARYRLDPNMKFWNQIKEGYDHFETTKREPQVAFCGRRYVFNATSANGAPLDANAVCPPLRQDEQIASLVAAKRQAEQAEVARLVSNGVRPVRLRYADGGQHRSFANVTMVSRPEALAQGPVEIALDESTAPISPAVRVASVRASQQLAAQSQRAASAQPVAYAPAPPSTPFYKRWLGFGSGEQPADATPASAAAPATAAQRGAATTTSSRQRNVQDAKQPQRTSELPAVIRGAQPPVPAGLSAFASFGW